MPQLDFFVWFDSLLTSSNLFVIFTLVGIVGGILVIKRGVVTKQFWTWCSWELVGYKSVRFNNHINYLNKNKICQN